MKPNYIDLTFITDRSGSMITIKSDAEGGFNAFIADQKKLTDKNILVNHYLFDDRYEVLYENKPINEVQQFELFPGGCTALYDAIGKTLNARGAYFASLDESERPEKVAVIIITDGYENNSKEFTQEQIRKMITHQREVYNWEFIFLAANQDAITTGTNLGISSDSSMSFDNNAAGVKNVYTSLSRNFSSYASAACCDHIVFTSEDRQLCAK